MLDPFPLGVGALPTDTLGEGVETGGVGLGGCVTLTEGTLWAEGVNPVGGEGEGAPALKEGEGDPALKDGRAGGPDFGGRDGSAP